MITNVCKVMQRLSDGDTITCTVKATDRPLDTNDYQILAKKMHGNFSLDANDILYFTVRTIISNKKDNYKAKNFKEVDAILKGIFNVA